MLVKKFNVRKFWQIHVDKKINDFIWNKKVDYSLKFVFFCQFVNKISVLIFCKINLLDVFNNVWFLSDFCYIAKYWNSDRVKLQVENLYVSYILKAMWNTFSLCLACSAERAIGAISLALHSVSHRLQAKFLFLALKRKLFLILFSKLYSVGEALL